MKQVLKLTFSSTGTSKRFPQEEEEEEESNMMQEKCRYKLASNVQT